MGKEPILARSRTAQYRTAHWVSNTTLPNLQHADRFESSGFRMMKNAGRWVPEGWSPMLVALGALAVAFALRYTLHQWLGEHSRFLFFTAAAILVCAYAGIWRALFVAIAGLLLGFYFFVQPYESFSEPDAEDFGAIVVYLLTTLVMLFLVEWLQRSKYEAHILMLETKYRNKRLEEVLASLSEARNSASTNAERVDMLA